mmetsp:Transcript_96928/g.312960  ORF Transcript_96928/g.312960 Transcript_96928/m.312960 type:complete len:232 (-) Transcript_96928:586-1281(-)
MGFQTQDFFLFTALFMHPVEIPVLQLLPTCDALLHITDLGLTLIPLPILGALDVGELRRIPAQGHFQLVRLELDDRNAGMTAGKAEHAQLPQRHVLQVLQHHGGWPRGHWEPLRGILRKAAMVPGLFHDPGKNLPSPGLCARQLMPVGVLQNDRVLVVVLWCLPPGSSALVVVVLVGLAKDHDGRMWHLLLHQGLCSSVVADGKGAEHDAYAPWDWLPLLQEPGNGQVHHQ